MAAHGLDQPVPRFEHRADVVARLLELHQRRLLRGERIAVQQATLVQLKETRDDISAVLESGNGLI